MLVTTCKHCRSRFRVTPDQLNLRQGQVRCGECQEVFNGFEALERFPGDDTGTRLLASRAGLDPHAVDAIGQLGDVDLGTRLPTNSAVAGDEPHGAMPPASEETPEARRDEVMPIDTASGEVALGEATPGDAAPRQATPRDAAASTPSAIFEDYAPEPPAPPSRAWAFGVALLAIILGLQLVYAYRARLAQQYPILRPVLESTCAAAGCVVAWPNDEASLKLEDSELIEVPGKPGQIALQARIRNLSSAAQEFPHLELSLTDMTGQTAIRRVLRPADYLGRTPAPSEVMAPGSEALLSIRLETGRIKPTGYELLLFYP